MNGETRKILEALLADVYRLKDEAHGRAKKASGYGVDTAAWYQRGKRNAYRNVSKALETILENA
jgi:hypothetical protein